MTSLASHLCSGLYEPALLPFVSVGVVGPCSHTVRLKGEFCFYDNGCVCFVTSIVFS